MKIALDPFMHRNLSLEALPSKVAELGYEWIELSPRADFLEWFKAPRVFPDRIKSFKKALKDADVGVVSLLPMYRWASNDETERQAAVRHWKRAIEIAVEMEVDTLNSGVRPRSASRQGHLLLLPYRFDDRGMRGFLVALNGRIGADIGERGCQPSHRATFRKTGLKRCSRRWI